MEFIREAWSLVVEHRAVTFPVFFVGLAVMVVTTYKADQ